MSLWVLCIVLRRIPYPSSSRRMNKVAMKSTMLCVVRDMRRVQRSPEATQYRNRLMRQTHLRRRRRSHKLTRPYQCHVPNVSLVCNNQIAVSISVQTWIRLHRQTRRYQRQHSLCAKKQNRPYENNAENRWHKCVPQLEHSSWAILKAIFIKIL
jgi:hypothetical protein